MGDKAIFSIAPLRTVRVIVNDDTVVITPMPRVARGGVLVDIASLCDRQEREWQSRANCMGVDPDLFFPERGASTREAKEVCRGCVVREDCLEYALANGEKFGIWGGLSERERRRLRRQRAMGRRAAQSAS
jgi:WhiB family transcriptional regulator, redox-sensing transcriptional regulator